MRRIVFYMAVFLCFTSLRGQYEANNWYFGHYAGITFNTTPPQSLPDGKMEADEGCAAISTPEGRLLFYTNGVDVWDSTHSTMPNGNNLNGNTSTTQSAIIIPKPGNSDLYYIFTVADVGKPEGLQYSMVNMALNGGRGDIESSAKNIPLKGPVCEKITGVLKSNGVDYWVVVIGFNSDSMFAYSVTKNGVDTKPVISKTGLKIPMETTNSTALGCLKISPDGKKIAYVNRVLDSAVLGNFDTKTGNISNTWKFLSTAGYGIEFSPQNKFLYITGTLHIAQYDLLSPNRTAFLASEKIIKTPDEPYALQLAVDGKIYIATRIRYLGVIHAPDSSGLSCHLEWYYIYLYKNSCLLGLPNFVQSYFLKDPVLGYDTLMCSGDSIYVECKMRAIKKTLWNTGANTRGIWIKKAGIYSVIITRVGGQVQYDTIIVRTGPKYKVFIGNDTAFCHQFTHLIKASSGFQTYHWNTGASNMQITVNSKGIYTVKVIDSNTCRSGDTIAIDEIKKPRISISYDAVNCKYTYLSNESLKGLSYLWSTGDTIQTIAITHKGWYSLTVSHPFCSNKDSFYIEHLSMPEVDLGKDTNLCARELVLKTGESGDYLWSTGENRPSIPVSEPGQYWLSVSRNNCSTNDTVNVKICEEMQVFIPDIFSPNNDGMNDVFRIYGSNITYIELEIFNRWGELLLKTSGKDVMWNGTYKDEACMPGVYFYKVAVKGKKAGSVKNLKGSVILLK